MTTLYIMVAGVAVFAIVIWAALRQARRAGGEKQRADDIALAKDAEAVMHDIQAEHRDGTETVDRLKKGGF